MTEHIRYWRLDAASKTLLVGVSANGIASLCWYGDALPADIDSASLARIGDPPMGLAKTDQPLPLSLFPQAADGLDVAPALLAHRNGRGFAFKLTVTGVDRGEQSLCIRLTDSNAGLDVKLLLELDATIGTLALSTELTNSADSALTIDWLASASLALPPDHDECLYLHGRWGLEFQTHRCRIGPQGLVLRNTRGRTSHEHYPGLFCGAPGFTETHADVLAAQLAWSGSHQTQISRAGDGRACLQSGIALEPGELILAAAESFRTPRLHVIRADGMNSASQAFHRYARQHLLPAWTRRPRPIHANSWEALYFDHATDKLIDLIDAAAAMGAERFVLDDGWFRHRRADNAGLGDWTVDSAIYPQGLHPVVDRVRSKGMQFGLWFEPEMVNPDSDLYRAHPEWTLHASGYDTPLARNQLALNMDLPQVRDYLFEHIAALVQDYSIDYIKWDMNRDLVLAGDGRHCALHRQPTACYALMARLNSAFPALEIESCASGGARADWGVLQHTGRVWTSDSIDAIDRLRIQRGYSLFCPPEIMGAHVGHQHAHLTGRSIDIHTRAIVALQGQFGYEIDARHLDAQEADTLRYYASLYKTHRHWIAESRSWRLQSLHPQLVCSGLVSQDQTQSLWFVVAESSIAASTPGSLTPTGLHSERIYRVSVASCNREHFATFCKQLPAWMSDTVQLPGSVLMKLGITLPVMPAQSALLLDISSVSQ